MNALTTTGVTKRYSNHLALSDVSITVPERSIYGLLGPNGAGKTTLIRIINQIINADAGEITLFGERLRPEHIGVIGYLPEERGLYKKLKVGEQLIYLARLKGLSHHDAVAKIKVWLERFEIKDWWHKKVEDLSKGMAQKVQFISTVMHEPRLIILDEPFSGFDPVNAQLITQEILQLRERGSTIIFSTHRMETVEDLCDHIALINKSQRILEGTKKSVKAQYKSNTYTVTHKGAFHFNPGAFELLTQQPVEDDYFHSEVRMTTAGNPNGLIQELTRLTEVHAFAEKVPTMSEIFITLVKGETHE
ncbi:MAG: ATP-binding cassette domain-containing protein [Cyclobacteriaceae bacterium]|nr:ATP-binding cassette domain-containing protein [Cyclobacteriaceae bacterium]